MKFLFATTNKAKIEFYANKLKDNGLDIVTLKDLNISCDIDETGKDPIENALIKAKHYNKLSKLPTIAIDDGLYFYDVDESINPGTHVRRVNNKILTDREMLDYYINLVNQYGTDGYLNGYFLKGIAIVYNDKKYTFSKKTDYVFTNQKSSIIHDGYPLDSLIIDKASHKFLSELSADDKESVMNSLQHLLLNFILEVVKDLESVL